MFSLSVDVAEKLQKEDNASGLIENLLLDFYGSGQTSEKKAIMKEIARVKALKQEYKDAEQSLSNRAKLFQATQKKKQPMKTKEITEPNPKTIVRK